MSTEVNPPPQLRIPEQFQNDRETFGYIRQLNTILFQLWARTGGSTDEIAELTSINDPTNDAVLFELRQDVGSGNFLTSDDTGFTVDSTELFVDQDEA